MTQTHYLENRGNDFELIGGGDCCSETTVFKKGRQTVSSGKFRAIAPRGDRRAPGSINVVYRSIN